MGIAEDIVIIVLLGLMASIISFRLKIPFFLGYIIIGVLVGPYIGQFTISNPNGLELLAEIGVALLLFSIGLELSFDELKDFKIISIFGTIIQFFIVFFIGYIVCIFYNLDYSKAIVFGIVISFSSTVIVLKLLEENNMLRTISGKVMIGMLVIQDIIAIPAMIFVSQTSKFLNSYVALPIVIFEIIAFTIVIIIISDKIVPFIFNLIVKTNSQELFLLSVFAVGLGIGYFTYVIGLSFAFGAFIAGIILNRTDYNHKALSDIIPLRDIFGLIFFVCIGMLFNPIYLLNHFFNVIFIVFAIMILKFVIFFVICKFFGYKNKVSIITGFGLSQIGELSFVIATISLNSNVINSGFYSFLISITVITMFVSPFFFMLVPVVYKYFIKKISSNIIDEDVNEKYSSHIIIIGSGRVGMNVGSILYQLEIPFIIIDNNYRKIDLAKKKNYITIYGDACNKKIIISSGIMNAKLLINTVPSVKISKEVIKSVKKIRADIPIIARVEGLDQMKELVDLHIYELVQPEFEASIEIIRKTMMFLNISVSSIQQFTDNVRYQKYSNIYGKDDANDFFNFNSNNNNISDIFQLYWIDVNDDSIVINKSLESIMTDKDIINNCDNVFIVGILRAGIFYPNPNLEFVLNNGDLLAVIGNFTNVSKIEKIFYCGDNNNSTIQ